MQNDIYIIDTSSLIDLFKFYPVEIFPAFWKQFSTYFDEQLKCDRIRIISYVNDEILHDIGKRSENTEDPAAIWIKERKKYVIDLENNISLLNQAKNIIARFPQSANIDTIPPDADPFLIAYVQEQQKQKQIENDPHFIIVTQEVKNKKDENYDKLRAHKRPIDTLTKIPSICAYYGIDTMNYMDMFKAENWKF